MKTIRIWIVSLVLVLAGSGWSRAEVPKADSEKAAQGPAEEFEALPQVTTYEELRHAVSGARAQSRLRVEKAVEEERVREAWEIGRLIDAHVLQHKERADYGEKVLERLSADLGMSRTELSYMLQFARAYPIFRPAEKLSWAHYEALLAVNDPEKRDALAERAEKESWSRDRLRKEVKAIKGIGAMPVVVSQSPLTAKPGKPGTYKIVKAAAGPDTGRRVIDLGFSNYYKTSKDLRMKEGSIIEAAFAVPEAGSAPSDKISISKRTPEDLFTYRAWVTRVLDGDTIEAVIDLGFGVRSVQTLRLRGIDAPELVTADGMEAKKALEKMLNIADSIEGTGDRKSNTKQKASVLIKTVKSDKYDRYLVDIFVTDKDGEDQYLNNLLLEQGYAVRVSE